MISETDPKKGGRPALPVNPMLGNLFPDIHSRLGMHDKFYIGQADNALGGLPAREQYPWVMGEGRDWCQGILVELGRIAGPNCPAAAQNMSSALMDEYCAATKDWTREVPAVVRLIRRNIANGRSA